MLAGLRHLNGGAKRLEAVLKGVAGFTGSGVVRYSMRADGTRRIDAELLGVAGRRAEIAFGGAPLVEVTCDDGAGDGHFDSAVGAPLPVLCAGDTVEVRQNGVAVLRGSLSQA